MALLWDLITMLDLAPPEILVDGRAVTIIRRAESFDDQIRNEISAP